MMRRRHGFTLLEALLGTAVMSVLALGIFRVFRTTNRQTSQAAWISAAQKELRTGLKRIHDELTRASVYTLLRPSAVEMADPETGAAFTGNDAAEITFRQNFDVLLNANDPADDTDVHTPTGGTIDLLSWRVCIPRREVESEGGAAALCQVYLNGNTLVFQRDQTHSFGDETITDMLQELVHNVVSVRTFAIDRADPNEPLVGSEVVLDVVVEHPNTEVFTNTRLRQTLTARVPVGNGTL